MRLTILKFIALCCLSAGCSSETDYSVFKKRLDGGASCEELFNLRNSYDPSSSSDIPRINEDLRGIGC
jgi:hypothetical protein